MRGTDTTAYDEVAYPSYVYPQTHPDRVATIATVLGLNPAPVEACRLREIARDIMRFHSKDKQQAAEKVGQGRAVIKWIAEAQTEKNSYANFLSEMSARLLKRDEGSIYHDELAEVNVPLYFHEFAKQAHDHGLRILSESEYFERSADRSSPAEAGLQ